MDTHFTSAHNPTSKLDLTTHNGSCWLKSSKTFPIWISLMRFSIVTRWQSQEFQHQSAITHPPTRRVKVCLLYWRCDEKHFRFVSACRFSSLLRTKSSFLAQWQRWHTLYRSVEQVCDRRRLSISLSKYRQTWRRLTRTNTRAQVFETMQNNKCWANTSVEVESDEVHSSHMHRTVFLSIGENVMAAVHQMHHLMPPWMEVNAWHIRWRNGPARNESIFSTTKTRGRPIKW